MKFPHFVILFFLSFLIFSCSYNLDETTPPEDLIPKDSFIAIVYDVMILESYYKVQEVSLEVYKEDLPKAMIALFEKHKIDSSRFSRSMDFYAGNQEDLAEIYNSIQDSLTMKTVPFEVEQ
ncbi:MAG TPA: DUF4296 domain-containing protein [Brumimicrobium sp.]|nr:DUF4296 domain-containing protein [Brumimicrobium sp.]